MGVSLTKCLAKAVLLQTLNTKIFKNYVKIFVKKIDSMEEVNRKKKIYS